MAQAVSSSTTKSSTRTTGSTTKGPDFDTIQRRAFEIYLARGGNNGNDIEDWLQAERELSTVKSTTARKTPRS